MGSITIIVLAALVIGCLLTSLCFGLLLPQQDEKQTGDCKEDCGVCPEQGRCYEQETREQEAKLSA